ncbi:DUF1878 family protein [Bacillus tianshenii]|nr:DUF1878 family protein [Bacillus tianshenii]
MVESVEERLERLEFYQQLLLDVMKDKDYPFYQLVIEKGLSKEEVSDVCRLCGRLTKAYEEQKELGFVNFYPLLIHFAGMLNPKLHPDDTMNALYQQKMYISLMEVLRRIRMGIKP